MSSTIRRIQIAVAALTAAAIVGFVGTRAIVAHTLVSEASELVDIDLAGARHACIFAEDVRSYFVLASWEGDEAPARCLAIEHDAGPDHGPWTSCLTSPGFGCDDTGPALWMPWGCTPATRCGSAQGSMRAVTTSRGDDFCSVQWVMHGDREWPGFSEWLSLASMVSMSCLF